MFDSSILGRRIAAMPAMRNPVIASMGTAPVIQTPEVVGQLVTAKQALDQLDDAVTKDIRANLPARASFASVQTMIDAIGCAGYAIAGLHWMIDAGTNGPELADGISRLCEHITALRVACEALYPSARLHYGRAVGAVGLACAIVGALVLATRLIHEPPEVTAASIGAATLAGLGALLATIATLRDGRHIVEVDRALKAVQEVATSLKSMSHHEAGNVIAAETTPLLGQAAPGMDALPSVPPPHPLFYA